MGRRGLSTRSTGSWPEARRAGAPAVRDLEQLGAIRDSRKGDDMSGYTIIDADTHVTETPDLWTSRAPAAMRDRVPRVITGADGTQRWLVGGGRPLADGGMTATAGVW